MDAVWYLTIRVDKLLDTFPITSILSPASNVKFRTHLSLLSGESQIFLTELVSYHMNNLLKDIRLKWVRERGGMCRLDLNGITSIDMMDFQPPRHYITEPKSYRESSSYYDISVGHFLYTLVLTYQFKVPN